MIIPKKGASMKKALLSGVIALMTIQPALSDSKSKLILGRKVPKEMFTQINSFPTPPGFVDAPFEKQQQERLEKFKLKFKDKPAQFSTEPAFDVKNLDAQKKKLLEEMQIFHTDHEEAYLLVNPEPLAFPPELEVELVSLKVIGNNKKVFEAKNVKEYVLKSSSSNGVSKSQYGFKIPDVGAEFDVKEGTALFRVNLPKNFEVIELTNANKKSAGFELVELTPDVVRVKFERKDGFDFSYEAHAADGKPLQGYSLGDPRDKKIFEIIRSKKWEEIPDVTPSPESGVIAFAIHGPAEKVILFKKADMEKKDVTSSWKKSY